LFEVSHLD
jgi:hypothetical protein